MRKRLFKSGMTLIELVIVMGILGILFAAVYMFFVKGTEQFHFTRRQNHLATTGRLALEMLSDEIIWAGYMPAGGWTEDQWHPIEIATDGSFDFYADRNDPTGSLSPSDYRNIYLDTSENILHITDDGSMDRIAGTDIVSIQFSYLDANGVSLSKPLVETDRDAVRHIVIKLTLESSYMGDVYQTVMQTMVTPRNLGVYHNFDPLFYMPPGPDAKIVVNVDGTGAAQTPTVDQEALVFQLNHWGFTFVKLADDELAAYDYDSSGVDLIFLRNMPGGTNSHDDIAGLTPALLAVRVPIIMLDPDDAVEVFLMGEGAGNSSASGSCVMDQIVPDHPIHDNISQPFHMYEGASLGNTITTIDSLYPIPGNGTELITASQPEGTSGVCVIDQDSTARRRVHLCAPNFNKYSSEGKDFLLNIIYWSLPEASVPPLGEEINSEGFEGESPGDVPIVFWEDDLEGGVMTPDSIPIYTDFGTGAKAMIWMNTSTGSGEINTLADETLEMHRTAVGSFDRNIAASAVDIAAYNAMTDELYITVESWKGSAEMINAEDGVFLMSAGGSMTELVEEDFESLIMGNGDVEFWGDLYGRSRVHSPEPPWNNTTTFATLDTRVSGNYGRSRMMIEVDASALEDGTPITVSYRMADHNDETNNYNAATHGGDYIGWSLGNDIDDTIEDYENLVPGSKTDGVWSEYSYTFTPSGSMPSTLYVIFSQYDNRTATSATGSDGISFDDITIIADNSSLSMSRIGTPAITAGWQKIAVDLDDAALTNSVPFSTDFGIALSQYGMGPWATYGMHWRYFELGVIEERYSLPGWDHEPMVAGENDDWLLEDISGNHKWTLHANDPNNYSNSTNCWLATPVINIPDGTVDAELSFVHSVSMESNWDYGWIEISTNGGASWTFFDTSSYNGTYGGHEAYNGTISTTTVTLDLDGYAGQSIQFRFVFESDGSVTQSGWSLDNFEATGIVSGVAIESIGFKPTTTGGSWYFNEVNVYLGNTPDELFLFNGEWDKGNLTYFGTYEVAPTAAEWVTIDLSDDYILPTGSNLIVKIEMAQTGPSAGYTWVAGAHPNGARRATSPSADPTDLQVTGQRPAFMIATQSHGLRYVDADSTGDVSDMPMAFNSMYSDFEGIYTLEELGFAGNSPWVPGGTDNDWEIGEPLFAPDVDPALISRNENKIAGNDLTVDGYYNQSPWNWIRSGAYEMSEAAAYDSVRVSYDRCLRRALNDEAIIQMAFTDTIDPPVDEGDWIIVKECDYDDDIWHTDIVELTSYFEDARALGRTHYFIRFVLSAGPFAEKGGWNIDNVGFYGRYAL